jgi:hypothetical protein
VQLFGSQRAMGWQKDLAHLEALAETWLPGSVG